jgi:hypothetical protein
VDQNHRPSRSTRVLDVEADFAKEAEVDLDLRHNAPFGLQPVGPHLVTDHYPDLANSKLLTATDPVV